MRANDLIAKLIRIASMNDNERPGTNRAHQEHRDQQFPPIYLRDAANPQLAHDGPPCVGFGAELQVGEGAFGSRHLQENLKLPS